MRVLSIIIGFTIGNFLAQLFTQKDWFFAFTVSLYQSIAILYCDTF